MRSFRYTIYIDRSPAQVWAYMMDFSKAPRWRNFVREVSILTDGPLRPGSQLEITFDIHGRVRTARCDVWAFETARRFGLRNAEEKVTGTFEYTLAPDGTGTAVTFTCDLRPHGLMWFLLPLMIRSNRGRYADLLPNLKQEVERS
jgi:uncharacterized protein YndB with AHSA1/START domain